MDPDNEELTEGGKPEPERQRESFVHRIEDHWIEIVSAGLLALATLMSAWCAFVAAQWHTESYDLYSQSNFSMVESAELNEKVDQQVIIDVITFTNYYNAFSEGDMERAIAYETRAFSPELDKAFAAWIARDPFNNPDAPSTPFEMGEYVKPFAEEAQREQDNSLELMKDARNAMENSDLYILLTIMFATVLFFAGISPKFKDPRIKSVLIILGACIFVSATVMFAVQP